MRDAIVSYLGSRLILPFYQRKYARFLQTLEDATALRRDFLLKHVDHCKHTEFGHHHGFSRIRSIDDFRRAVPVAEYSDLHPLFERVAAGEQSALLPPDEKILAFACTTGTTGTPKRLPVTRHWLDSYQRWWRMWGCKAVTDHPGIATKRKRWLQISGPLEIDRTQSGLTVGMVSAISARYQNPIFHLFYCVPYQVGDVASAELKNYILARLSMAHSVGFIITITAANLIRLAQTGNERKEDIIRDIHDGMLTGLEDVAPSRLRQQLSGLLRPRPARAKQLEQLVDQHDVLYPKHYWDLELISCWTGGTVGYQSRDLPLYYGDCPIRDIGYISTEGRHTIPADDASATGVLVPSDSFYEFIPEDGSEPILPHELETGHDYSVLLTSANGLFRYRLADIVACRGHVGQSPLLEFLRKTCDISDLEGEKISAEQAIAAVKSSADRLGIRFTGFCFLPDRPVGKAPRYVILIEGQTAFEHGGAQSEQLSQIIDAEIMAQNVMYRQKRSDGSLGAPQLMCLPSGTLGSFANIQGTKRGTGESQFKLPVFISQVQMDEIGSQLRVATARDSG